MARNNGGFILIKIDKDKVNISSSDFDKSLFRKIFENKIKKPLLLESKSCSFLFNYVILNETDLSYWFSYVETDGDLVVIAKTSVSITYSYATDELTYEYSEL